MKILVPNQTGDGETRVASTPAVMKKLLSTAGVEATVERGAGVLAGLSDAEFAAAGAHIAEAPNEAWADADVVLLVRPPSLEQARRVKRGALIAGMLAPAQNQELIAALNANGASVIALELLPRVSRAQSIDALSSQANLAGYKAVILAAASCPKIFPMLMTAAGTLQPAKVFVIGAGVAGLQAIATARRLGAVVSAYDVRAGVKEQVQSVGARFVELPLDTAAAQGSGGYAAAQTEEMQRRQQDLMARTVAESDVVITTASIPGKPAPRLISAEAVGRMRAGSVIVDLAASGGGNCELTVPGQTINHQGVIVIGTLNLPATLPAHASQMFAGNLQKLLALIVTKEGQLKIDTSDEVIAGMLVCHDGQMLK